MIAKIAIILGVVAASKAGGLYDTSIGYASNVGYGSGYYGVAPYSSYVSPIVKTLAPIPVSSVAYTPAISTVSQYSIHQAPVIKPYTPIAYSYASPYINHGYTPAVSYASYGGYGYGGYGSKYAW